MSIASQPAHAQNGQENRTRLAAAKSGIYKSLAMLEGITAGEQYHVAPAYDRVVTFERLNETLDALVTQHWCEAADDGPENPLLAAELAGLISVDVTRRDGQPVEVDLATPRVRLPVSGVFQLSLRCAVPISYGDWSGVAVCDLEYFAAGHAHYSVDLQD